MHIWGGGLAEGMSHLLRLLATELNCLVDEILLLLTIIWISTMLLNIFLSSGGMLSECFPRGQGMTK